MVRAERAYTVVRAERAYKGRLGLYGLKSLREGFQLGSRVLSAVERFCRCFFCAAHVQQYRLADFLGVPRISKCSHSLQVPLGGGMVGRSPRSRTLVCRYLNPVCHRTVNLPVFTANWSDLASIDKGMAGQSQMV